MSTLTEVMEALPRLFEVERYDLLRDLAAAVPNIVKTPKVCGGEACFVRTRIPVWTVGRARQLGASVGRLRGGYSGFLPLADRRGFGARLQLCASECGRNRKGYLGERGGLRIQSDQRGINS